MPAFQAVIGAALILFGQSNTVLYFADLQTCEAAHASFVKAYRANTAICIDQVMVPLMTLKPGP